MKVDRRTVSFKHLFDGVAEPVSLAGLGIPAGNRPPALAKVRPMSQPSQSSAVVTGAARGIGRAIAERLVARGFAVVVTDVNGESAARTATEIGAAASLTQDVRDEASHHEVATVATKHGPLAVWVNNAGVGFDGPIAEQSSERVRALVDINFTGVLWGCRAAVEAMTGGGMTGGGMTGGGMTGGGEILNVASLSGHGPVPGLAVYAATKAAVVSLTGSLDSELRGRGIRVHAICPDGVDTKLVADMDHSGQGAALIHSGGPLLTTAQIAEHAVGMLGTHRVVRTVPAWRGGMMRLSAVAPSVLMRLEPVLRWEGRRRMGKTAKAAKAAQRP
jgi:NAD(P)-dependent dehydrogenase (short-subunit alcohol dehydrogenase family)